LDSAEYERHKQFEQRFERRLVRGARHHYQQNCRRQRIRSILYALWYAMLAFSTVSTVYHLAL
jgi:hypothetical protein